MNYSELTWPSLPNEMETSLINFCANHSDETAILAKYPDTQFFQFDAPDYLKQWVHENLTEITEEDTIQLQIWKHTDYGNRHLDFRRAYSYNYVLMEHPGITRWFEDDGTFIESVNYKHKKWYKHIGSVKYHDVLNVNNFRPAVTIYKRKQTTDYTRPLFWKEK